MEGKVMNATTTQVAVVKANTDYSDVEDAIRKGIKLIGGLENIIRVGQRVLLKPNLLEVRTGEQGATTDKRVVGTLVKMVKELGALPIVGDAAGIRFHGATERVLKQTGMREHCEALGAEVVSFDAAPPVETTIPEAKMLKSCHFASTVLDCDMLISVPKIKTHFLTRFTGAVKNLLGTLPGGQKTIAHLIGATPEGFAQVLVDIYTFLKPKLTVMDAVVGMGGTWRDKDRVEVGLIIVGWDGVAVDAVASHIVGFNPMKIPTLHIAAERGLGEIDLNKIEILGEEIDNLSVKRLAPRKIQTIFEGLLFSLHGGFIRKQAPKLLEKECNSCKHCQQACPANAVIFENKKPRFDLDRCIRCFCCHELCPQRAITIDRGWRDILLKPFV
jgi:uncharacterized protein (DUF362 family)/Pyruvate/2-oxoacid:ferredoxin oxidoreductase delta subunit